MFSDPQFWVFIAFIIFVAAIFFPVRKILISNLDKKISEISNNIEEAEKIKNDTQLTLSEIKKRQTEVISEIKLIDTEAQDKIKKIEKDSNLRLKEQIKKKNALAKLKIEQVTREANDNVKKYISETAIQISLKIIESKLNEQEKQELISQSIKEINSTIKN